MNAVKVPATPPPKTIDQEARHADLVGRVRVFDGDIKAFVSRAKAIEAEILLILEGLPEHEEVGKALTALAIAQDKLKRRLAGNSDWIRLTEELADERLSLKDAKANMSEFLLGHFHQTGEKQIELGPSQAREVIINARLGKEKDFQTNIFSAPPGVAE